MRNHLLAAVFAATAACAGPAHAVVVSATFSGILNDSSHLDTYGLFSAGTPAAPVDLSGMRYTLSYRYDLPATSAINVWGEREWDFTGAAPGSFSLSFAVNGRTRAAHDGERMLTGASAGIMTMMAGDIAANELPLWIQVIAPVSNGPRDFSVTMDSPLTAQNLPGEITLNVVSTNFALYGTIDSVISSVDAPDSLPLLAAGAACMVAARELRRRSGAGTTDR